MAPTDVDDQRFIERDALATAASLLIAARTRKVHQDPARAKSDAQNALRLELLPALLEKLGQIHAIRNTSAVAR